MKTVTKEEYNSVRRKSKKFILSEILYNIHALTERDDKYTLTNAYFESRYGEFEVI